MKNRMVGWTVSLGLHGVCVGLILLGGFHWKKTKLQFEESMPCTVPLEVETVTEISQAPVSQPKGEADTEKPEEKKTEEKKIVEDVLPTESVEKEEPKEPVKDDTPPKEDLTEPAVKEEPMKEEPKELIKEELPVPEEKKSEPVPEKTPAPTQDVPPPLPEPKKQEKPKDPADLLDKALQKIPNPPVKKKQPPAKKKIPKKSKSESDDFIKVLKDLSGKKGPAAETPITDPNSTSTYGAARVGTLSVSIVDRVKRAMQNEWRVPLRAHEGGALVVAVLITLNPDATVNSVEVLRSESTTDHPAYVVGEESALAAVNAFRKKPLPLPLDLHSQWKSFRFNFSPDPR
jgi:outer membrane biosynthesis protein TonB